MLFFLVEMGKSGCCTTAGRLPTWREHSAALAVCSMACKSEGYCNCSLSFAVTTLGASHEEFTLEHQIPLLLICVYVLKGLGEHEEFFHHH